MGNVSAITPFDAFGSRGRVLSDWRYSRVLVPPYQVFLLRAKTMKRPPPHIPTKEHMLTCPATAEELRLVDKRLPVEDEHIWGIQENFDEIVEVLDWHRHEWLNNKLQSRDVDDPRAGEWLPAHPLKFVYWLLWNGFVPGEGMDLVPEDPSKAMSPANATLIDDAGNRVSKLPNLPQREGNGEAWVGRKDADTNYMKTWRKVIRRRDEAVKGYLGKTRRRRVPF